MFRTILVPLNGSHFAEAALPTAVRLARGAGADLHLVLAHQPVAAPVGLGETIVPPSGLDDSMRIQEWSYLAGAARELRQDGSGPVAFSEVEGPAGPAICEEASRLEAALIVMATHGRGAVGRLWLGSVADYVVRHASIPVLLIHPPRRDQPAQYQAIREILVALDLTPQSETILEPATALARLTGAHLTLVHVVDQVIDLATGSVPITSPRDAEAARAHARAYLDRIRERMAQDGVRVSTLVLSGRTAAGEMLQLLAEPRFDLMAMTTYAGGMRRLFIGSVAGQVIRKTAKPVLVLRPPPAL